MESLSKRGHKIRVIDFEARSGIGDISQSMKLRVFQDAHRTDPDSSVSLIRPGMIRFPGFGRLSSILTQFRAIFENAARWCNVIVLYSVPTNGLQTLLASKILDKPIVFHSFDILHRMTNHDFLRPPTWALERLVYQRVNRVVVISQELGRYMSGIGVRLNDIVLLPPAVNVQRFDPSISGKEIRSELGIEEYQKVVLFSGWLYEFCGLDLVLSRLGELLESTPDLTMVICGDGPLTSKLCQIRDQLHLERCVKMLGRRSYEEMPSVVASADICINPYLPDVRSNFAFPSKIAEYMASGKPVISTDLPGTRSMLGDNSGVILAPASRLIESLKKLLEDDDMRKKAGDQCRRFCEQNFSLDRVVAKFEQILAEVVSERVRN